LTDVTKYATIFVRSLCVFVQIPVFDLPVIQYGIIKIGGVCMTGRKTQAVWCGRCFVMFSVMPFMGKAETYRR